MQSIEEIAALLRENNITYVTEGHNTKQGELSIACPFCGDDPSQHLGVSPTGAWACWRNRAHSGRNINRLLRALGIETKYNPVQGGSLEDIISGEFFKVDSDMDTHESIIAKLPSQFKLIGNQASDQKFRQYLVSRKFSNSDLDTLIDNYNLMRSSHDDPEWHDRIIIASVTNGRVYWTGRSIYPTGLRYKSPKAEIANIKDSLLRYDDIITQNVRAVLVTEGFVDAIKMGFYRPDKSIEVTCTFGINVSDQQINLLKQLENKGVQILIGFDADAAETALQLSATLNNVVVLPFITKGYKDFGALPPKLVKSAWDEILTRIP